MKYTFPLERRVLLVLFEGRPVVVVYELYIKMCVSFVFIPPLASEIFIQSGVVSFLTILLAAAVRRGTFHTLEETMVFFA